MAVAQVVSSDGMSAELLKPVYVCDVCGFQWNKRPGQKPTRCASQKCRSVHWDAGKKFVKEWQAKEKKPGRPKLAKLRPKAKPRGRKK